MMHLVTVFVEERGVHELVIVIGQRLHPHIEHGEADKKVGIAILVKFIVIILMLLP